jgi:hypothetical protein
LLFTQPNTHTMMNERHNFDADTVQLMYENVCAISRGMPLSVNKTSMEKLSTIGMRILNKTDNMWGSLINPPTKMKVVMIIGCLSCPDYSFNGLSCPDYSFNDNTVDWPNANMHSYTRLWNIITRILALGIFDNYSDVIDNRNLIGFCRAMNLPNPKLSNMFLPSDLLTNDMIAKLTSSPWERRPATTGTFTTVMELEFMTRYNYYSSGSPPYDILNSEALGFFIPISVSSSKTRRWHWCLPAP